LFLAGEQNYLSERLHNTLTTIAVDVAALMLEPQAALPSPTAAFLATLLRSAIRAPNRLTTLGENAFCNAAPLILDKASESIWQMLEETAVGHSSGRVETTAAAKFLVRYYGCFERDNRGLRVASYNRAVVCGILPELRPGDSSHWFIALPREAYQQAQRLGDR
jgi:hypothetical protein